MRESDERWCSFLSQSNASLLLVRFCPLFSSAPPASRRSCCLRRWCLAFAWARPTWSTTLEQVIPTGGGGAAAIGGEISGAKVPSPISCSTGPNRRSSYADKLRNHYDFYLRKAPKRAETRREREIVCRKKSSGKGIDGRLPTGSRFLELNHSNTDGGEVKATDGETAEEDECCRRRA